MKTAVMNAVKPYFQHEQMNSAIASLIEDSDFIYDCCRKL